MSLSGSDHDKLLELCGKSFKDQAIWFLNAYWDTFGADEAENIWKFVEVANEVDVNNNGILDEFEGHRFLERVGDEMTVLSMRNALRKSQALEPNEAPKTIPLSHVLIIKYDVDWHVLVNAAQGDNKEEVEQAQRMLEEVQHALELCKQTAAESKQAEADAVQAEKDSQIAKAELEAALAELQAQENAYNNRTEELKRKSNEGGVVAKNKAKNELAQHLAEDPLPLRRAKINQEAAVKRAERAAQEAADRKDEATSRRLAAEQAVDDANQRFLEAEAFLQEVKSKPGSAAGALWWIDRELHEAKAYLPQKAG
eukprot:CAMPEP_0174261208 /NCGR_PEP_ID=MMETSP0439-20130205/11296_1 /TAXON_ID=0 /ORGANISM="Stereomyxa ramosa, Strain Chinc5" /LENGTH=311 /DNA_ID=CAMNT_0015345649 /DNA_START=20 /DNA_END=952 /DNA_ORIENTATION=+